MNAITSTKSVLFVLAVAAAVPTFSFAQADVAVSLTGSGVTIVGSPTEPIRPGGIAEYLVIIRNLGPGVASDVRATVTFPPLTEVFDLSSLGTASCTLATVSGQPTVTCLRATMNAGNSFSAAIRLRLDPAYPSPQALVATAAVTSLSDPVTSNDAATVTLPVSVPIGVPTLSQAVVALLAVGLAFIGLRLIR